MPSGGKTTPVYGIVQGYNPYVYLKLIGGHHGTGQKSYTYTIWANQATVFDTGAEGDTELHLAADVGEWAVAETIVPLDVPS